MNWNPCGSSEANCSVASTRSTSERISSGDRAVSDRGGMEKEPGGTETVEGGRAERGARSATSAEDEKEDEEEEEEFERLRGCLFRPEEVDTFSLLSSSAVIDPLRDFKEEEESNRCISGPSGSTANTLDLLAALASVSPPDKEDTVPVGLEAVRTLSMSLW